MYDHFQSQCRDPPKAEKLPNSLSEWITSLANWLRSAFSISPVASSIPGVVKKLSGSGLISQKGFYRRWLSNPRPARWKSHSLTCGPKRYPTRRVRLGAFVTTRVSLRPILFVCVGEVAHLPFSMDPERVLPAPGIEPATGKMVKLILNQSAKRDTLLAQ